MSKYCILSDLGLATQTDGTVTICNQSRTLLKDSQGQNIRLNHHSIVDGWNSITRKEIKESLLLGNQHENCKDCWDEEAAGRHSLRLLMNKKYKNVKIIDQPQLFMLKPGNACNLSCRHCNPYVSSNWYKDHYQTIKIENKQTFKEYVSLYEPIKQSFNPQNELWQTLKDWNKGIIFYDLYGAEPLLINPLLDLLRNSVETKLAKNQDIHVNTNGTIWQEDFNHIFSQFRSVELAVSIDGIGPHFEYMRYPANWSHVLNNLIRYKSLADNFSSIKLSICITVSLLNVYYLVDYLNFFSLFGIETTVNIVHRPNYLNMRIAPNKIKQLIINHLQEVSLYESAWIFKVDEIVSFICSTMEDDQKLFKEFWHHTNLYDKLRDQKFSNTFPEYYKILTDV